MNFKREMIGLIIVTSVAIAAYMFYGLDEHKLGASTKSSSAPEALVTSSVDSRGGTRNHTILSRAPTLPAPELARDNPYWAEMMSPNRTATFRRLAALDDPAAAMTAYEISIYCGLYWDEAYPKTLAKIESGTAKPGLKAKQRQAAEKQRSKCVGFTAEDLKLGRERYRYVFEKGDPRGVAFDLPTSGVPIPDRIAIAQAAAQLKDPLAIREVGAFFLRRADLPGGNNATIDLGDGTAVSRRVIFDAFVLAACSFGDNCGPDHVYVAARCVNMGRCDSANIEDAFIYYNYSPADSERLLAAHQMVLNGLRTGQWPSTFWTAGPR
jgi:hypothetical protein